MMQSIFQSQNEEKHINQLAAQRQIYSETKRIHWFLFIVAVPVTIFIFILGNLIQPMQLFAAFWGGIISIIEFFVLNNESKLRLKAAKIQELFDTEVLQLQWNQIKCRAKPDIQDILHYSQKHFQIPGNKESLKNWYFEKEDCLPIQFSRLICQRANLSWDSDLRRRFAQNITIALAAVSIIILGTAIALQLTMDAFILYWLIPALPIFIWGCMQRHAQFEAANNLDKHKESLDIVWDEAFKIKPDLIAIDRASHDIQDEIFKIRSNSIPIPDLLYKKLRQKYLTTMCKNTQQLCEEALELIRKTKSNNHK